MTRSKVRGRVFLQAWVTSAQAKQIELFLAGYEKGVRELIAAQRLTAARRQLEAEIDDLTAIKNNVLVAASEAEAPAAPSTKLSAKAAAEHLGISERQIRHLAQLGRIPGAGRQETPRGLVWVFWRKPRILPPARPPGRPKKRNADES